MNLVLLYFAIKYDGDGHKIYDALDRKEKIPHEQLEHMGELAEKEDMFFTTVIQRDYPKFLNGCFKPPFVIFSKKEIPENLTLKDMKENEYFLDLEFTKDLISYLKKGNLDLFNELINNDFMKN